MTTTTVHAPAKPDDIRSSGEGTTIMLPMAWFVPETQTVDLPTGAWYV
jgi:hypothetical protein